MSGSNKTSNKLIKIGGINLGTGEGVFTGNTSPTVLRFKTINVIPNTGLNIYSDNENIYISGRTQESIFSGITANNGLQKLNNNIELGGILVKNTTISGATNLTILVNNLNLSGSTTLNLNYLTSTIKSSGNNAMQYFADYSANYNPRSIPDVGFVTGLTQNAVSNPAGSDREIQFNLNNQFGANEFFKYNYTGNSLTLGTRSGIHGSRSFVVGLNNIASGLRTISFGENNQSNGDNSFTSGRGIIAQGNESQGFGWNTRAYGNRSFAQGTQSKSYGADSHSHGFRAYAFGDTSHAEGSQTKAYGNRSHVEGSNTIALGDNSHAEGRLTKTYGNNSHAEGLETYSLGDNSHAEGAFTTSVGTNSHAEGFGTYSQGFASHTGGYGTSGITGILTVRANGIAGFNHSMNDLNQTDGHGANANRSAILGGLNHNIELDNVSAAIIGGENIKLTGSTYIRTTAVDNLAIFQTPQTNSSTDHILVWNETTKKVEKVSKNSIMFTGSSSVGNLQVVTDNGNQTTNDIELLNNAKLGINVVPLNRIHVVTNEVNDIALLINNNANGRGIRVQAGTTNSIIARFSNSANTLPRFTIANSGITSNVNLINNAVLQTNSLLINNTPNSGSTNNLVLVWDSVSKQVRGVTSSSFISSFAEIDTLQSVTERGATTDRTITIERIDDAFMVHKRGVHQFTQRITNNGFWNLRNENAGINSLVLNTNGKVYTNANFGINNPDPNAPLHIQNNDNVVLLQNSLATPRSLFIRGLSNGGNNKWDVGNVGDTNVLRFWNHLNSNIEIGTNNNLRIKVTNGGLVGLNEANPTALLHLTGGDVFINGAGSLRFRNNTGDSGNRLRIHHNDTSAFIDYQPELIIRNSTTNLVSFNSNGNIGIGTTSQSNAAKVHIVHNNGEGIRLQRLGASQANMIRGVQSNGITNAWVIGNVGNDNSIQLMNQLNANLNIGTNNEIRIVVNNNGNVGIGTLTPQTRFHLVGNTGSFRYQDGSQGAGKILTSDADGNATWGDLGLFTAINAFYVNGYNPNNGSGSITDPFKTIDLAVNAVIGNGTRNAPQFTNATIFVQAFPDYVTSTNLAIRDITYVFESGSILTYTGNGYLVDLEISSPNNFQDSGINNINILGQGSFIINHPNTGGLVNAFGGVGNSGADVYRRVRFECLRIDANVRSSSSDIQYPLFKVHNALVSANNPSFNNGATNLTVKVTDFCRSRHQTMFHIYNAGSLEIQEGGTYITGNVTTQSPTTQGVHIATRVIRAERAQVIIVRNTTFSVIRSGYHITFGTNDSSTSNFCYVVFENIKFTTTQLDSIKPAGVIEILNYARNNDGFGVRTYTNALFKGLSIESDNFGNAFWIQYFGAGVLTVLDIVLSYLREQNRISNNILVPPSNLNVPYEPEAQKLAVTTFNGTGGDFDLETLSSFSNFKRFDFSVGAGQGMSLRNESTVSPYHHPVFATYTKTTTGETKIFGMVQFTVRREGSINDDINVEILEYINNTSPASVTKNFNILKRYRITAEFTSQYTFFFNRTYAASPTLPASPFVYGLSVHRAQNDPFYLSNTITVNYVEFKNE